jgi:HEAT repeat protein
MTEDNHPDMNDDIDDDQLEDVPEAPAPPEPEETFDPADVADVGESKVNRGNRGMLIVFLVALLAGGVVGALWYLDKTDYEEWQKKMDDAAALAKGGDDAGFRAALRDILDKCERKDILVEVIYNIGLEKDVEAVPGLIKAIGKGELIAEEAALALAKIGGKEAAAAADPIFAEMNKSEELRRYKHAWALCMLGDDRGFPILLEGVSKQMVNAKNIPDYDPDIIARVGSTDKLIELAATEDPMLKMYAAMELGFRTDKDPVPALLKLITDPNRKVAEAAAVSLGRTADDRAGKALLDKIKTAPELLESILTAVTQSVGAPGLEAIYNNTDNPAIKYSIIGKIKKLRDPRSTDLLIRITDEQFPGSDDKSKLEADQIRNQALWTLEELGDKRIGEKMYAKTLWEPVREEDIPDASIRYRQDDMARKIANGVAEWFGVVKPDGVADYLTKIYNSNEPYSNTPECAQRVKVDIGPLMDAMGRSGDQRFCSLILPFLDKEEGFYSQAAAMALGRLKCPKVVDVFLDKMVMTKEERKEEKFSTLEESRDWQMEDRLQERRNTIIATRYLGDPKAAATLMTLVLDPVDDPELRQEAADSLAYTADAEVMADIIEKVKDPAIDIVARANLIKGLWHNTTPEANEAIMSLLEGELAGELVRAASIAIGEAADPALAARLNKLLDHPDEQRQRGAVLAILLGGNLERIDRIMEILEGQEASLVIREWYEEHQVFVTKKIFETKRIFHRLDIARELADRTQDTQNEILWPWKHLMQRLKSGWDTSPGGLTAIEVRHELAEAVRNDADHRELAASVLSGLDERGFLLALQAEKGPASAVARETLRKMNIKSE